MRLIDADALTFRSVRLADDSAADHWLPLNVAVVTRHDIESAPTVSCRADILSRYQPADGPRAPYPGEIDAEMQRQHREASSHFEGPGYQAFRRAIRPDTDRGTDA